VIWPTVIDPGSTPAATRRRPTAPRPITRGCRKLFLLTMENFTSPWDACHGERKIACIPW